MAIRLDDTLRELKPGKLRQAIFASIPAIDFAIINLMSRPKLNWNWRIDPEQRLCIEFADALRVAEKEGRLKAVFTHPANEGKRHIIVACILKAMGMLPGTPDYVFTWAGGGGWLEAKAEDKIKPLKGNQADFQALCQYKAVPHAVFNTVELGLQYLQDWGALT